MIVGKARTHLSEALKVLYYRVSSWPYPQTLEFAGQNAPPYYEHLQITGAKSLTTLGPVRKIVKFVKVWPKKKKVFPEKYSETFSSPLSQNKLFLPGMGRGTRVFGLFSLTLPLSYSTSPLLRTSRQCYNTLYINKIRVYLNVRVFISVRPF
jgi:hypothetical protein